MAAALLSQRDLIRNALIAPALGAAVTIPNDANVMLPDLIKYLLFMILNLDKLLTVSCTLTFVFCA